MSELAVLSTGQMRLVLDVSRALAVTVDLDSLLRRIAEATTSLLGCERASIFLHDKTTDELWTKVALKSEPIRVPAHRGICGHAFSANEVLIVASAYDDPRFNQEVDKHTGFRTQNLLAAPMVDFAGKPVGVLQALNKIGGVFSEQDKALVQLLADQAGVAIQRHELQREAERSVALKREMDLARRVQERLWPTSPLMIDGLEVLGWARPASITGGDGFDIWRRGDGGAAVFLADASGHGLAPAMVVSQARTLVRALAEGGDDPHGILEKVNRRMAEDLETGRFVTAFLGFVSPDGVLKWSSAGHGPVLVKRSAAGVVEELPPCGMPIGVAGDWIADRVEPIRLEEGGSLLVLSDGIFEAPDAKGNLLGIEPLTRIMHAMAGKPAEALIETVRQTVRRWQGHDEPVDDQTIVVANRG